MPGMTVGEAEACLVGDFTPRGLEARYLYCSARLSKRYGRLVVDTDGWVHGEGLELKAALVAQLDATGVAIGLEGDQLRALKQYISDLIARRQAGALCQEPGREKGQQGQADSLMPLEGQQEACQPGPRDGAPARGRT